MEVPVTTSELTMEQMLAVNEEKCELKAMASDQEYLVHEELMATEANDDGQTKQGSHLISLSQVRQSLREWNQGVEIVKLRAATGEYYDETEGCYVVSEGYLVGHACQEVSTADGHRHLLSLHEQQMHAFFLSSPFSQACSQPFYCSLW